MHLQLFRLLQRRHVMPITASVVLLTFTWLLVYPTALAAQTAPPPQQPPPSPPPPSAETELPAFLKQMEARLQQFHDRLARGEDGGLDATELEHLRQRLAQLDTQARQQFDQMAQHLQARGLPEVIHQRHQDAVATYDAAATALRQQLDDLAAAPTPQERQAKAAHAVQHLRATQPPRAQRAFDPHRLPFRTPEGKVRKAKETKEDYQTSLTPPQPVMVASNALLPGLLSTPVVALPATPTPDDLAPTEDVQLTDEIRVLTVTLGNNPVHIYNWVHDQIEFMPTYGSIQGSHMTLQTKRGNAFDTASLLIALLRAANIPARYVYGTVQIPIEQVMNWVGGVTVPEAALEVLGQGGIPHTGMVQGGVITAVRLEHVWVEAWVDFFPSQGAVQGQGETWVALDGSFKQYQYTAGIDLYNQVPFDAQAFLTQATQGATLNVQEGWVRSLHQANMNAVFLAYQEQVQRLVGEPLSAARLDTVLGVRHIRSAVHPVLTGSLPYLILVIGVRYATLPTALRHHVTVALYANEVERTVDTPTAHYSLSLPALSTQRLGVTYIPATAADQQLLGAYQQQRAAALPLYLLRVLPQIQLDGRTVATGTADHMGQRHIWSVTLRDPHEHYTRTEDFLGSAGDELVFGVNGNGLTEAMLRARFATHPSATAAENLQTVSLVYWLLADVTDAMAAALWQVVHQRLPSVGLFAVPLHVQMLFGIPYSGFYRERRMDIARDLLAVAGNEAALVVAFRMQSGWQHSYLEGAVFDMVFGHPQGASLSTVQLLREANAQGIPLYTLTAQTLPGALPRLQLAPEVLQDIHAAVGSGRTVLVSAREVASASWAGVGYVIQDPVTGAGEYLIQGGFNGGIEGGCGQSRPEPVIDDITDIIFALFLFIVLVALIVALIQALPILAPVLAGAGAMALAFDVSPAMAAAPSGEPGLWRVLFQSQYGPYQHGPTYPGDGIQNRTGTCTDQRHGLLHREVGRLCSLPGNRECIVAAQRHDCPVAKSCALNSFACIHARLVIMFECFGDGNRSHWIEMSNRLRGLGTCVDCMVENGCTNPFIP